MKCLSLFANVGIGETYFDELGVDPDDYPQKRDD